MNRRKLVCGIIQSTESFLKSGCVPAIPIKLQDLQGTVKPFYSLSFKFFNVTECWCSVISLRCSCGKNKTIKSITAGLVQPGLGWTAQAVEGQTRKSIHRSSLSVWVSIPELCPSALGLSCISPINPCQEIPLLPFPCFLPGIIPTFPSDIQLCESLWDSLSLLLGAGNIPPLPGILISKHLHSLVKKVWGVLRAFYKVVMIPGQIAKRGNSTWFPGVQGSLQHPPQSLCNIFILNSAFLVAIPQGAETWISSELLQVTAEHMAVNHLHKKVPSISVSEPRTAWM